MMRDSRDRLLWAAWDRNGRIVGWSLGKVEPGFPVGRVLRDDLITDLLGSGTRCNCAQRGLEHRSGWSANAGWGFVGDAWRVGDVVVVFCDVISWSLHTRKGAAIG